jgi:hypothetical protein
MRTADEAAELIRRYLPQIEAKQVKELPHTAWAATAMRSWSTARTSSGFRARLPSPAPWR